jgi:hypothetical protein
MKISGIAAASATAFVTGILFAGAAGCSSSGPAYPNASSRLGVGCLAASTIAGQFTQALGRGSSVITAHGVLTGKVDTQNSYYYGMSLDNVHTIGGAPLPSSLQGWILTDYGANTGSLWAPDGSVLAIARLDADSGTDKPVYDLTLAPLVNGQVVFSSAGCWPSTVPGATAFHGPLQEIPGSGSYAQAGKLGFHAVPLTAVEQMLNQTSPPSSAS